MLAVDGRLAAAVIGRTHELLRQVHDYQESALD